MWSQYNSGCSSLTKTDLFNKGLTSLQNAGIVTGLENEASLAGLVSGASKFGVDAVKKWTEGSAILGKTLNGANSGNITAGQMNELVAGGKFAVLEHQMDPTSNFLSYRSTLKAAVLVFFDEPFFGIL